MNPSYTNIFNHCTYSAVEGRKSANPFVGHVISDECNPNHYIQKAGSVNQSKEKDVEKIATVYKEGTLIKSIADKSLKIIKDDA